MRILILGTGIAGLSTALKFAETFPVTLVAKVKAEEGSTRYAQGGIASVWSKTDSFEEHEQDTLIAGAGLCNEAIVKACVQEGPSRIRDLIDWGVQFTKRPVNPASLSSDHNNGHNNGSYTENENENETPNKSGAKKAEEEAYDLHREGGHGKRRILHADDLTGQEIERALLTAARLHKNIEILEHHVAVDLITDRKWMKGKADETKSQDSSSPAQVLGAYLLETKTGTIRAHSAALTILATGGAGKIYLYTSNPDVSTGDGIAMAYRAGAKVANLEFMQFHPTCLYHPLSRNFLISEALRGEGAVLRNMRGAEFMGKYHAQANLAPRDIVTRAIDLEMKRSGDRHVLLDATHLPREWIHKKFPNIYEKCWEVGIDIAIDPIPVVPAAHYMCGGVQVDENGSTSLKGLYAVGEAACTGLHGANRLASNSLLESVVFAHRVYESGKRLLENDSSFSNKSKASFELPAWDSGTAVPLEEQLDISSTWLEIRTLMWNYVGIVRSNARLERAKKRLEVIQAEVQAYYWKYLLNRDLIELRNLVLVADLIVRCANLRKESRGLHHTVDFPKRNDADFLKDTVI